MTRNRVSPCPRCGGVGYIPDGEYKSSSFSLDKSTDADLVLKALYELKARTLAGESPDDVKEEIGSRHPLLKRILTFAPKNPSELAAYLVAAIMIVQCSREQVTTTPLQVQIQVELSAPLAQALSEQNTNRQRSPEPHKATRDKQGPESLDI